ncbi:MAG: hypothetical protein FP826_04240 [Sphingomonadales bacterium]|nr:hypothetical protein [Sphingomonadales bacterium]MBU3991364.1 hypothetical protein [Alphaproteobacteria bacterium]
MALFKAIIPGFLLNWIVSSFVGASGSRGGVLAIRHVNIEGYEIYGSWPLFFAATGLAWAIFKMME